MDRKALSQSVSKSSSFVGEKTMALPMPKYIAKLSISTAPITFEWDDANPSGAFSGEVPSLENKVAKLPKRVIAGLAVASAEWVVFRLSESGETSLPLQYIEAAWAAIVDWGYLVGTGLPSDVGWSGPRRGPLWKAIHHLRNLMVDAPKMRPIAYKVVSISNLAEYVLPDSKHFKKWRKVVLDRLLSLYPLDPNDKLGPAVPREAYDPDFDFKIEMTDDLIAKYLQSLDFPKNPYLKKT
jgi:hypothetical protein